ncbi:MAG: PD-(D/E)XK nuclease family protein [Nanoarchaeota archaeon]|nr:PD-(D/E)XK nuclease family protein [Nanoarchaeota archaeon]
MPQLKITNLNKKQALDNYKQLEKCPYCQGKLTKKGKRKKKYEEIQIYFCKNCNKKITPLITKNKTYPLKLIIDTITFYNRLNSLEETAKIITEKHGIKITHQIISNWLKEYERYIPFLRMRDFANKNYKKDIIQEAKLFHQQIYNFKYNRAKLDFILNEEFRNQKFHPLQEFLELAIAECPNQIFQNSSKRASDYKNIFNLDEVKITPKTNFATKSANFILQAVSNNKARHEALQDFMIANDSTTIATELAVLIGRDDINHYKFELGFDIPITLKEDEYITGHIDFLQIRNGNIYILDYKPSACKQKPIEQLTIYALALSRLTGIRLYHIKCAYFDEKNYYEFFPLHVVYKLKNKRIQRDQTKIAKFK